MRLIGGLVLRDPAQPAAARTLQGMASRVTGAGEPVLVGQGQVGLMSCVGADAVESSELAWAVGDLDLTNLEELSTRFPRTEGEGGLLTTLHAREGLGLVGHLRGAFALAFWDRRLRQLLLAVDRFGITRLYYAQTKEGFAFASRPSPLLAIPGVDSRVDSTSVYHYLNFGFVPAPGSIFAGIRRLPPGYLLVLRDGESAVTRYWDLAYPERPIGLRDAAAATFRMVEEAVRVSLHGAVAKETGAFLSGGTDSSSVVGLMGKVTGERVNAFSIGFREPRYSELHYAELAARHFGATHYTHTLTADEALTALPGLVAAYDEPFGNDSSLATYSCAKLARECGMARLLAGDGGDELFGGNERYRTDRIFGAYGRIPRWLRGRLLEPVLRGLPDGGASPLGRAQRYVRRATIPNPRRFYSYQFFVAQEAGWCLAPDFMAAVDLDAPWRVLQEHFDRAGATSELNRLHYLDIKLTIGDNDLLKVTRTAELAGVDVRFPMLDHPLAEFTGTLPARYKVRGLEKRYLFKRAFRDLLPAEILAKRKHGFGVPVSDWLKTHPRFRALARDTLRSPTAGLRQFVRPEAIDELLRLHEADDTSYYGSLLWMLLMLELWHGRHVGRPGAA